MKRLLIIMLFSFSYAVIGQISLNGKITGTQYSQGGAARIQDYSPFILANLSFYFVQINSDGNKGEVIKVKSDSLGQFKVTLAKGKYAVSVNEHLPVTNDSDLISDPKQLHSITWSVNKSSSIIISEETRFLSVHRHETNICYMCP